jgi:hypothetical protein
MTRALRLCLLVLVLGQGCKPDEAVEPLPIDAYRTYDLAPVRAIQLPDDRGTLLLCRRAPSDPSLDHAQLLDINGEPGLRIPFGTLPRVVENITFLQDDVWITDVLPTPDGGFVAMGLGLQRAQDDRLHLLMYRLNAGGVPIGEPGRRFICNHADVGVRNDIDRLFDASVRATLIGADGERVAAVVRYGRQGVVERRMYMLPRSGSAQALAAPPIPLGSPLHHLQFIITDPQAPEQVLLGYDTTGTGGASALRMERIDLEGTSPTVMQSVTLLAPNARVTDLSMANGALTITGHADPIEPGVLRPFIARITDLGSANAAIAFPDIAPGRSVCPYALDASIDPPRIACAIYEQAVVTDQLRRNDLFADLAIARVDGAGNPIEEQLVLPGQGLRPLAMREHAGTAVIVGVLHPFLNVELVHAFHLRAEIP